MSSSTRGRSFSRRGGRAGGGRGGKEAVVQGLFTDGQWLCNCSPRLPAEHFKVKKESANKGRWFYTCQKGEGERCGFFLWDDDAKPREEAAVLGNSRTEPLAKDMSDGQRTTKAREDVLPSDYKNENANSSETLSNGDDEDNFPWSLTGEEEAEMEKRINALPPPPVTPRKSERVFGLETPVTGKRKISEVEGVQYPALPTPRTSGRSGLLRFEDRSMMLAAEDVAEQTTPSGPRHKDALASPFMEADLTGDVMRLIKESKVQLSEDARTALHTHLSRHSLRLQGVIQGRNVTRLQVKAKEAKIAEQQLRIASLEAELEHERALVQHLRWEQQSGQEAG